MIAKKRKPCDCGAKDEDGKVIEHFSPRHSACLRGGKQKGEKGCPLLCSHEEVSLNDDGCQGRNFTRFVIKISLRSVIRTRRPHAKAFLRVLKGAIPRLDKISFDGMEFATFHLLRVIEAGKEIPELNATFFRRCFHAVSRLRPDDPGPTPMEGKDPELAASFKDFRDALGADATFAHREGLTRAIEHVVNAEMTSLQNHVKVHLATRIERWLTIRLERELHQEGIKSKHVKWLAKQMVARVWYDEKKNAAIAINKGERPPPIPCWSPPGSARDVLGEDWLGRFAGPRLTGASLDAIWQVWETLLEYMGKGKLPLCQTHFDKKDGWKAYFPLLCKMLADVEAADACQPVVPDAPVGLPSWAWGRREAKKILCGSSVSWTVKDRAAKQLVRSIIKEKPFDRSHEVFRALSEEQLDKLEAKGQETIGMIKAGTFRPEKYLQRRGPHRLFHILPQHGFTTRYFPMDRQVFLELHRILWKDPKHPHPQAGEFKYKKELYADFFAREGYWWDSVFDLRKLKGVHIPGVDIPGRSEQQKHFSFFMSTDGVGCSFVCWKPKRQGGKKTNTAANVTPKKVSAVDPGVTNLVTGIRLNPGRDDDDGQEGMSRLGDRKSVFKISTARWRDEAYRNGARRCRNKLLRQAKKRGIDIRKLEKSISSGKTMRADVFLKHTVEAVRAYPTLYEHYKQHRVIRWKTYRKEQKAMHETCMRVKGDPSLKKEDVVVAYGAAQFGSTMVGKQPVPVKRFLNMLKEYVTIVPIPEDRTSRVCSNGCCQGQAGSASGEDELVPMRGEGNKSKKKKGRPLHAVLICLACGTIWDRDVNAARNIARIYLYREAHGGQMPLWTHRRRRRRRNHN